MSFIVAMVLRPASKAALTPMRGLMIYPKGQMDKKYHVLQQLWEGPTEAGAKVIIRMEEQRRKPVLPVFVNSTQTLVRKDLMA